ncbi:MAG: hypothetical protein EBZ40_11180, partial [Gammaproteobacteria bacterium]|nr:hypothetical protein [Gammaproteobacteria bacterium]
MRAHRHARARHVKNRPQKNQEKEKRKKEKGKKKKKKRKKRKMGQLYDGATATRDTVLGPGVALVSLDVTFHEDGTAVIGLGRTETETPVWAYTIAHGVAVRAGQTRTFAAFGPA